MKNVEIVRGKIYRVFGSEGKRYRLLNVFDNTCIFSVMDITFFDLFYVDYDEVFSCIQKKIWVEEEEESVIFDYGSMSQEEYDDYLRNCCIMQAVVNEYGPDYRELLGKRPKKFLKSICAEYQISRLAIWRMITRYFQSGFNSNSLIDKRHFPCKQTGNILSNKKRGRKSKYFGEGYNLIEQDLKYFKEALAFFKEGKFKTKRAAYDYINSKFYRDKDTGRLLPESSRPTLEQFYYYFNKNISKSDLKLIKTSRREYDNNNRNLYGNRLYDIRCPGWAGQIDACETPFSLVSKYDPRICVSNPTVYFMVDVYTSAITAVSVAYTQNSNLGFTNLMLNLMDDKVVFCKKYGIEAENINEIWPSGYIPRHIYVDRGSEFTSEECTRICNELGVEKKLVPGAKGSAKGLVERSFGQLLSKQVPYWEKIGYISKRHDSNPHGESVMDIEVYTKCVIQFVLTHNQRYMEGYPMVKELRDNNVPAIPFKLWEYGVEHIDSPRHITDINQYCFTLMTEKTLKLSRKGINYKTLYYINRDDTDLEKAMADAGNKSVPFKVRMDPRDVSCVYYLRNNRLCCAKLSDKRPDGLDYSGMTLQMYDEYYDRKKKEDKSYRQHNDELAANNAEFAINVAKEMKTRVVPKVNTKMDKIREARHIESALVSSTNKMLDRMDNSDNQILGFEQEKQLDTESVPVLIETPKASEDSSDKKVLPAQEEDGEDLDLDDFDSLAEFYKYK
ncbi:MAG: transposase family protein [Phascolarctobacterium sp.]|nr:transposase family protein [Phascolarctobacterium sp.]